MKTKKNKTRIIILTEKELKNLIASWKGHIITCCSNCAEVGVKCPINNFFEKIKMLK